jgi:hypothetical protein
MQFKRITLFLFTMLCWYLGSAQIVLTAETNAPQAEIDTIYIADGATFQLPEAGENMLWDYSGMDTLQSFSVEMLDVTNNSLFPTATLGVPGTTSFQVFSADVLTYRATDADGHYDVGYTREETSFPLTALTGNPDDTFTFVADTVAFSERSNRFAFPLTYPGTFTHRININTPVELSVAGFGLSQAPVTAKNYRTEEHVVTGYGTLILPMRDMSPSPPIDVLLVQKNITIVDSFFLAGMLPPQVLLDAFGVSQGQVSTITNYLFYTTGLRQAVFDVAVDSNGFYEDGFFRPRAVDFLMTGTQTFAAADFSLSPNPLPRGQNLILQADQDLAQGTARFVSLNGQVLSTISLPPSSSHNSYEIAVPEHLAAGLYLLQVFDQDGQLFKAEKVIIQ